MPSKILIIHPHEGTRESLKFILSDYYNMVLADSWEQSEDILRHDKTIELIIGNANLPEEKEFSGIPTLIIIDGKDERKHSERQPALKKPFKADEILKTIQDILS